MSDKYFFSQGNASFEKGDFSRAISFYSSAININPENLNYYRSRFIAFLKNKDFDQAFADANTIANRYPESDYGYLLLGVSYLASNQLERAEDYLVSAHQRNPANPITKSYLDQISKNRQARSITLQTFDGNFQDLIPQFQENPTVINNFAGNPSILNALNNYLDSFDRPANIRYEINKFDNIRFQNKEFLTKLLNEAKSNFKANQFQNAIQICHKGIMSCNENTESEMITSLFQIITSSYMKMGEIKEAVIYSQQFPEFARKNGFEINDSILKNCEYIQIAFQNYNELHQKNSAITRYEQSKRSDEMPVFFKKEIANSVKNNKIENAAQIASEAVSVFPNDPALRYTRAKANFMIEQYDAAIADCQKAIEIKPDFSKAHFLIAKCYMRKNEPKKARFFVRRTLFYDRENVNAVEMIGQIKDMIYMQKEEKLRQQIQQQQETIAAADDNVDHVAATDENIGDIKSDNQKESDANLDGQTPLPSVPPNFQQNQYELNQEIHEVVNQNEQNIQNFEQNINQFEQRNFNQNEPNPQNFEPNQFDYFQKDESQMNQPHSQPYRFNRYREIQNQGNLRQQPNSQDYNQANQRSNTNNLNFTFTQQQRLNIQTSHNNQQQQQPHFQFQQRNFVNNRLNQNEQFNGNFQQPPHSQPPPNASQRHTPFPSSFASFRIPAQHSDPPHSNNLSNFHFSKPQNK